MVESKKYIIELTNDCNLSCEMCPRQYLKMDIGYMSMDLWLNIIDTIPPNSTVLPFWRGESTLHPKFESMIKCLDNQNIVLATNGTNVNPILNVIDYFSVINVSIHNSGSYAGYDVLRNSVTNGRPKVISSMVEGESELVSPDRIYKKHTVNGKWGRVDGISGRSIDVNCPCFGEYVVSWDGKRSICHHVWDTSNIFACSDCSQWEGNGKTL